LTIEPTTASIRREKELRENSSQDPETSDRCSSRFCNIRIGRPKKVLALYPDEARATLVAISKSKHFPHAGDAGMCLWALDEGIFKPS